MITGPSVGPGMLLTVLMRWPALIAVLAVGGGGYAAYKEFGLPEPVQLAIHGKSLGKPRQISDSDMSRVSGTVQEEKIADEPVIAEKQLIEPVATQSTDEEYAVQVGDTLSKIVKQRSSNLKVQAQLMEQIYTNNPTAFKGDPNQLRADVVIHIPIVK